MVIVKCITNSWLNKIQFLLAYGSRARCIGASFLAHDAGLRGSVPEIRLVDWECREVLARSITGRRPRNEQVSWDVPATRVVFMTDRGDSTEVTIRTQLKDALTEEELTDDFLYRRWMSRSSANVDGGEFGTHRIFRRT